MMQTHDISHLKHSHAFTSSSLAAERGTKAVMWITVAMMVVEIWAGWWFNSMALLADGWHMSSHALAIGLSAFAYAAARRYAYDTRFAFGTWKIEVLGGFASALLLLVIAALMVVSSVERLLTPQTIHFKEAIVVAIIGLAVNIVCAIILARAHHHDGSEHGHSHHDHHHHDLNLRSAYLHVVADAATSVFAIAALFGGMLWGWNWLDPAMGIVGATLVALWAKGLLRDTSRILLDSEMDHPVTEEIREVIQELSAGTDTHITDLHVWRVGQKKFACILSLATSDENLTPIQVRDALSVHEELAHITVEIHAYPNH